jgi:hypothetical protein
MNLYKVLVDWLEVWALLIPIVAFMLNRMQPAYIKPVIAYVIVAFVINLLSNISWKFKHTYNFPVWYQTNTYFYSIHSIVRGFLLGCFFILLNQPFLQRAKKAVLVLFLLFIIINFMYEPFVNYWYENGKLRSTISYRLLAVEAAIMLFYCLQYYVYILLQDDSEDNRHADFWIVTGLAIFSFCSFPIYIFYNAILNNYHTFTVDIWLVQKISFLIFCLCLARAFYISKRSYNVVSTSK